MFLFISFSVCIHIWKNERQFLIKTDLFVQAENLVTLNTVVAVKEV